MALRAQKSVVFRPLQNCSIQPKDGKLAGISAKPCPPRGGREQICRSDSNEPRHGQRQDVPQSNRLRPCPDAQATTPSISNPARPSVLALRQSAHVTELPLDRDFPHQLARATTMVVPADARLCEPENQDDDDDKGYYPAADVDAISSKVHRLPPRSIVATVRATVRKS